MELHSINKKNTDDSSMSVLFKYMYKNEDISTLLFYVCIEPRDLVFPRPP